MVVLIGCEESQTVCAAFRARGHEAYSCDLIPTRGNPDWHIQGDVIDVMINLGGWDLIILHPVCTAMALSGNRWYGKGMPRHQERIDAVEWTVTLWNMAVEKCARVIMENPKSVLFPQLKKVGATIQYIHPWQYGHGEQKETGLALHGVPELKPTNIVEGREQRIWRMAPGPDRKRDRSKTFEGIAAALADQYGFDPNPLTN